MRRMPKVELIPTAEVARRLGRDVRTVHRWVDAGRLVPAVKTPGIRGALLFRPRDVEKLAHELDAERQASA
jgi:DNA-binding transcriptional MerR regulator